MDNALLVVLAMHLEPNDDSMAEAIVFDDAWDRALGEDLVAEIITDEEDRLTYITSKGRALFAEAIGHEE